MEYIENKQDSKMVRSNNKIFNLKTAKRLLSNIISDYQKDTITTEKAKTTAYLLTVFVNICKEVEVARNENNININNSFPSEIKINIIKSDLRDLNEIESFE